MKSWSLGASLAVLGALAEARNGAWQRQGADSSLDVLDNDGGGVDSDSAATCGDEGWLRFLRIDQTRSAVLYARARPLAGVRRRGQARARRATMTGRGGSLEESG